MKWLRADQLAKIRPTYSATSAVNTPLFLNRNPVTKFIKRAYHTYVGMKLGDQDKAWAPHMVCKTCTEYLRRWINGKKSCLKFGIYTVWRGPTNHDTDYYFCVINLTGTERTGSASSILIFNEHVVL